jgi:hypothetical protein
LADTSSWASLDLLCNTPPNQFPAGAEGLMPSHQGTLCVGPQLRLQDHTCTRLSSDFFACRPRQRHAAVELVSPSCGSTSRLTRGGASLPPSLRLWWNPTPQKAATTGLRSGGVQLPRSKPQRGVRQLARVGLSTSPRPSASVGLWGTAKKFRGFQLSSDHGILRPDSRPQTSAVFLDFSSYRKHSQPRNHYLLETLLF